MRDSHIRHSTLLDRGSSHAVNHALVLCAFLRLQDASGVDGGPGEPPTYTLLPACMSMCVYSHLCSEDQSPTSYHCALRSTSAACPVYVFYLQAMHCAHVNACMRMCMRVSMRAHACAFACVCLRAPCSDRLFRSVFSSYLCACVCTHVCARMFGCLCVCVRQVVWSRSIHLSLMCATADLLTQKVSLSCKLHRMHNPRLITPLIKVESA